MGPARMVESKGKRIGLKDISCSNMLQLEFLNIISNVVVVIAGNTVMFFC